MSITFIVRIGSIVKACVIKAERKELKGGLDYILVMQYRTHIILKSFISPYSVQIEKGTMIAQPMIFLSEAINEMYFLQKDGLSIKLQQIKFTKEQKDPINTFYEFKSNKIKVFTYHEGKFFIMDESLQIKEFTIDPKSNKVKFGKTLEMTNEDKDSFEAKGNNIHSFNILDLIVNLQILRRLQSLTQLCIKENIAIYFMNQQTPIRSMICSLLTNYLDAKMKTYSKVLLKCTELKI